MKRVCVLLSAYNGEKYIRQQIDSILHQDKVNVQIIIRDDGSTDGTVDIVKSYKDERIQLIEGKNVGFALSFWKLIMSCRTDADYYSFCDQDDYWMDDKLISAITCLENESGDLPKLYTSNVYRADENLVTDYNKVFLDYGVLTIPECLRISRYPGCTFVFNRELKKQLEKYKNNMIAHDWTTYIIANCIGKVFYDPKPRMLYRIHSLNTIGVETKMDSIKKGMKRFVNKKQINTRSKVARKILSIYGDSMSDRDYEVIDCFANYRKSFAKRIRLLKYKEYRKPAFVMMLMLNRV